jgi:hypothetical protein
MQRFNLLIATLLLTTFLLIGSVGVMAMTSHHHEPGCPFMPGEMAICMMDALDHITAWQKSFTITLPTLVTFLLLVSLIWAWKFEGPPRQLVRYMMERRSTFIEKPSLYQELFSSGILNPKAP